MDEANISYAQTPRLAPYLYCTISDRLRKHASATPNKAAFVIHSVSGDRDVITCREIYSESLAFAKGLVYLGINKGETVGLAFPNSWQWLISTFGTQLAGAVPLHMGYKYKDGRDIIPTLQNTGNCKALIMDRGIIETSREFIENIISGFKMEHGKTEVNSVSLPALKFIILHNQIKEGCLLFSYVLNLGITSASETNLPELDHDDVAAFLLTSGSTGLRKLVPKTHLQLLEIGQCHITGFGMKNDDVYFNDRLFNWGAGYPTVFLVSGATHITCSDHLTLGSVKDICDFAIKVIKCENCTVSMLLPVFILEVLKRDKADFRHRVTVTAGVPVPREGSGVIGRFADEFINAYGSTEMDAIALKRVTQSNEYSSYCVGRPFHGVELKVVNSKGKTLERNRTGELYVRHQVAFSGYKNDIAKTSHVLNSNGWYKTDDSAYMDDNGDFFVIGRCSDTIISYGELIAPSIIEDQIREHPSVADVCVVPLSDPICFQKVCACIVVNTNASLKEDELRYFLSSHKTYKQSESDGSRVFLFFENLPKTAVGKIFRQGVKEAAEKLMEEL